MTTQYVIPSKNQQTKYTLENYRKKNFHHNINYLKKLIFPPTTADKIPRLMIDNESIKYITYHSSAEEITNVIKQNLIPDTNAANLIITEMTAGVGGNVLNFAKHFKLVNAIELNPVRYQFLNKNIEIYELSNIKTFNGDSVEILFQKNILKQDILFFDPPWGGPNYKSATNLRLDFSHYSLEHVCNLVLEMGKAKMIVIKMPNNYDFKYFYDQLSKFDITKINISRMSIVIIKNLNLG